MVGLVYLYVMTASRALQTVPSPPPPLPLASTRVPPTIMPEATSPDRTMAAPNRLMLCMSYPPKKRSLDVLLSKHRGSIVLNRVGASPYHGHRKPGYQQPEIPAS